MAQKAWKLNNILICVAKKRLLMTRGYHNINTVADEANSILGVRTRFLDFVDIFSTLMKKCQFLLQQWMLGCPGVAETPVLCFFLDTINITVALNELYLFIFSNLQ